MREKSESERKILGMLLVFITVTSVFTGFVPVLADDPLGEDGMPIPSAMTLIADPAWIYINGDESFILATVYDHENYTVPIPNVVVIFETTLGTLRNVSYGGSITPTQCWAMTNESGVAIAAVMPVIGSDPGNATVKAVTGKGDVWQEVTVEFVKAEWRVVLFPDALSKATAVNEDVTYTIMVRNAGTAADTYTLSIPLNEAYYAVPNRTSVSLPANTSEFVTLTVRDPAMGRYNTTVRAASPHASWEVTLLTVVRAYGVDLTVEGSDHAEKTVAPGVPATYLLTLENTGSDMDSYDLSRANLDSAALAQLNQTSVLNLAAGAKADVLLTVSDPDEDAYRVNVTATSQGRPGVSDTISTLTTVQIPLEPDLLITEIALNCGSLFGNESNELCATVKNNGTAAAGPFNVSFNIGVFSSEARVAGGLAAGATTVVCVIDPTSRQANVGLTILARADCDTEINESDEDNNARSIVATVVNNGYKGKRYTGGEDIATRQTFELRGDLLYSTGDSQYLSGFSTPWTTYTVAWTAGDLPVPGTATVEEARLYVIYTWDKVQGMPNNVSLSFNGMAQTRDAFYTDRKGYAPWDYPYGMLAYDVTANFSTAGNTAILTNLNPVAGNPSLRGMLLVVIYEDESEPERTIILNEEFDLLYGGTSACTTPEEATAYAPFDTDIQDLANVSARLITMAPGAGPSEGELLFNGQTWTNVWNYAGSSQIGIDDRDVTAYLQADENEAGFQSSADYMEASVAILVVETTGVQVYYNLTITSTAGGSVTEPGEGTRSYLVGTVVNLTAEADTGFRFVNWTGDVDQIAAVNAETTTITMRGNYSIVANFEEIPEDTDAPEVTNPTAEPFVIPDDTDHVPAWGEVADLRVTVTDASAISSVTINLSAIGGNVTAAMARIGSSDVWNISTNASEGTYEWNGSAYVPHKLWVTARDEYTNENGSVCVELLVMKNGDVTVDGKVNFGDGIRLINNYFHPGDPNYSLPSDTIADVTGDGKVNFGDGIRLINNYFHPADPNYILK